jgi:hypothetical protein
VKPDARRGCRIRRACPRWSWISARPGEQPLITALRFTLPPEQKDYSAQVWLEVSSDMKRWETIGAAELNWLVNRDAQTLVNDRLDFAPRTFRYARLSWRNGTPVQFASIIAEQPVRTDSKPAGEQSCWPAPASSR